MNPIMTHGKRHQRTKAVDRTGRYIDKMLDVGLSAAFKNIAEPDEKIERHSDQGRSE